MDPAHSGGDMSPLYVPRKRKSVQSQPKSGVPCPGKEKTAYSDHYELGAVGNMENLAVENRKISPF